MKIKEIKIINKQGYRLCGLLHIGEGKKLIIICNGYDSTKESPSIQLLAEHLNVKGYDVFRFDFSGTGESEGPKNIFIQQQVEDLDSVIDFFKNYKTLILLGGSLGAVSASIVSISNSKVSHLITVNGFFGSSKLGNEVRRTYFLYRFAAFVKSDYRRDYAFFKKHFLPEKITVPVSVLYTKTDNVVDPVQSEEFYSKLCRSKNRNLISLLLQKHNLTGKCDVSNVVASIHV